MLVGTAVFQNTRLEPFLDQAEHACVIDPMLQKTDQPLLADRIEEASEVRVKNIVHLCAVDSGDECVQRIVLAALGPEPVREAKEVFLVDRVQHRACRLLDDLVFECGNCERALLTISLRYVMSPRRQSPICSPMDPGVQVLDLAFEVCLVVLPCQPIHTRCGSSSSATAPRLPDAGQSSAPQLARRGISRFPTKELLHMHRFFDHAGPFGPCDDASETCCRPRSKQRRHPGIGFRGSMAGLCPPLPTLRRHPYGRQRTARGRCGSLLLHRSGLAPPTPCRSPGALRVLLHAQPV